MILKILLITKLIVVLILLLRPMKKYREEVKGKEYLLNDTRYRVDKMGVVISVNGKQRSGKSLTSVLLAHTKTELLQIKLQERLDKIIVNYVEFDFNNINEMLDNYFINNKTYDLEELYFKIFGDLKGINFDFLNMRSVKKDLSDYIDFYYILNYRMNYIISNFYIFSRITMTKSKVLNSDTLELKNLWKTLNYNLDRALVIVNDEQNIENGNVNSNSKEMKTSGRKELSSLIGNIYEELVYMITTKQVHEDEFVGTRRLEVSRIDMNSCNEIIYNFKFFQKMIDRWLSFKEFLFTFKYKLIPFKSVRYRKIQYSYQKANNRFRRKEYFWQGVKSYLNAQGIIVANVDITENKKTIEEVDLFFPLKYGYGTYLTHDYACVQKELKKMSKCSFADSEENERFETEQKIRQKSKFLYENKDKEEKEKNKKEGEVIEIC